MRFLVSIRLEHHPDRLPLRRSDLPIPLAPGSLSNESMSALIFFSVLLSCFSQYL